MLALNTWTNHQTNEKKTSRPDDGKHRRMSQNFDLLVALVVGGVYLDYAVYLGNCDFPNIYGSQ